MSAFGARIFAWRCALLQRYLSRRGFLMLFACVVAHVLGKTKCANRLFENMIIIPCIEMNYEELWQAAMQTKCTIIGILVLICVYWFYCYLHASKHCPVCVEDRNELLVLYISFICTLDEKYHWSYCWIPFWMACVR